MHSAFLFLFALARSWGVHSPKSGHQVSRPPAVRNANEDGAWPHAASGETPNLQPIGPSLDFPSCLRSARRRFVLFRGPRRGALARARAAALGNGNRGSPASSGEALECIGGPKKPGPPSVLARKPWSGSPVRVRRPPSCKTSPQAGPCEEPRIPAQPPPPSFSVVSNRPGLGFEDRLSLGAAHTSSFCTSFFTRGAPMTNPNPPFFRPRRRARLPTLVGLPATSRPGLRRNHALPRWCAQPASSCFGAG